MHSPNEQNQSFGNWEQSLVSFSKTTKNWLDIISGISIPRMFFNFPQPLKVTEEQLIEVFHTQCCKKTGLALCVMMPENIGYGATTKSRITGKTFMSLPKVVVLKQRVGSLVRGGSTAGDVNFFSFFFLCCCCCLCCLCFWARDPGISTSSCFVDPWALAILRNWTFTAPHSYQTTETLKNKI